MSQIEIARELQISIASISSDIAYLGNQIKEDIKEYLIEPTSKVKVEYSGSKILEIAKVDDSQEQEEVSPSPPPFSLLYFDLHTFSGILSSDDGIRLIKVRYEDYAGKKERQQDILFQNTEENCK